MNKSSPQIIGIIPIRYASVRFQGKALAPILGKTLIERTYKNALQTNLFDKLWIATDDERIYKHVSTFTNLICMTSESCLNGTDRIIEALQSIESGKDAIIVNIQGDLPCLEAEVMQKVIEQLLESPLDVMATAATPIHSEEEAMNEATVKCVLDLSQNALYFSRSLIPYSAHGGYDKSITYYHHLGIYAYRRNFLEQMKQLQSTPLQQAENLEQLKVLEHGYNIKVAIVESKSFGVDRPEDIAKVEKLI